MTDMNNMIYKKSHKIPALHIPSIQSALTSLTQWVRGTSSTMGLVNRGRFSTGNTTPEKKNIGDKNPVKKKLKWFIFFTNDVTSREATEKVKPVKKPTKGANILNG